MRELIWECVDSGEKSSFSLHTYALYTMNVVVTVHIVCARKKASITESLDKKNPITRTGRAAAAAPVGREE